MSIHARRVQQNRLASHLNATVFWMWFRVLLLAVLTVILVMLLVSDSSPKRSSPTDGSVSSRTQQSVPPSRF